MEGWLVKKGHNFKTWQKRYFVLEKHRLSYYEKDNKKNLKGTYILSASAHISKIPDEGSHKFLFVLHAEGSGGSYLVMSAANVEDLAQWENGINGMINLYKKPAATKKKKTTTSESESAADAAPNAKPDVATSHTAEKMATPASVTAPAPDTPIEVVSAASTAPESELKPDRNDQSAVVQYAPHAPSYPAVVTVLGSSGGVGQATVSSLSVAGASVSIQAGTRDVYGSKAASLRALEGVRVIDADMSSQQAVLAASLSTSDRVFVVTPGHVNRAEMAINAINACRDAGVGYMLVLSVASVVRPGTIFADQFLQIEAAAAASGVPHTIVRLPLFLDNILGQLEHMVNNGQYYVPVEASQRYNAVVVSDVGDVCATILADPSKYVGRTLTISGSLICESEIAAAFSVALEKTVQFVQVPDEAAKASMLSMGMPEWQADGVVELYKMIEAADPCQCEASPDTAAILGRPPVSISEFANRFRMEPAVSPNLEVTPKAYAPRAPSNPAVVTVLGSSGAIGISTLSNLGGMSSPPMTIHACVRDVASVKMKAISHIHHVNVISGDMGTPESLVAALSDADRVFIVTPGAEDRADLVINAINACKEARVGYMLVLSVMTVERPNTIFANQFLKIEAAAAASGIPHTIIRLPFFLDNVLGQLQLMMNRGQYFGPISPSKKHNSIAVSDVGEAAAKILADPAEFIGQVLELCGPLVSEEETAAAFSANLGQPVEYVQVSFEAAKASMVEMGLPEWQASGIMEMFQLVEDEDGILSSHHGELERILGRPPTTINQLAAPVEFLAPKEEPAMDEQEVKEVEATPAPVSVPPAAAPVVLAAKETPDIKRKLSKNIDSIFIEGCKLHIAAILYFVY